MLLALIGVAVASGSLGGPDPGQAGAPAGVEQATEAPPEGDGGVADPTEPGDKDKNGKGGGNGNGKGNGNGNGGDGDDD